MKRSTSRLSELTYLNVWLCFGVILIHVVANSLYGSFAPFAESRKAFTPLFLMLKLSAYVVPGFIFLSAVKFFLKFKNIPLDYPKFLLGRITKIIIPYVIWFFIYLIYLEHRPDYSLDGIDLKKAFWQCTLVAHFYFIAVITQFYILMPIWLRIFKKYSAAIMLPLTLFVNILALYMIPDLYYYYSGAQQFELNSNLFTSYIFFWCAGAYVGLNYEKVTDFITTHIPMLVAGLVLSGAAVGMYTYIISVKGHMMYFTDILYIFYQTCIIFFLLAVFNVLSRRSSQPPRLIRLISESSYGIYLSHILFIFIAEFYCGERGADNSFTVLACRLFAGYIVCITLCILYSTVAGAVKRLLKNERI